MKDKYEVYVDGACANNQASGGQPGGWGVVFLDGREYSGGDSSTTNNRMELKASIEALNNTPKGSIVEIYSDSAYVVNAFKQNWISKWIRNGWKTATGKPVENQDLWKPLISLEKEREVEWIKVKGHSGNKWNDIADRLAVEAIHNESSNSSQINIEYGESKLEEEVTLTLSKKQYDVLIMILNKLADKDSAYRELYKHLLNK